MSERDGGPVSYSPKVWFGGEQIAGSPGLTLRDYFAGHALGGQPFVERGEISFNVDAGYIAKRCYDIADAMLKERDK